MTILNDIRNEIDRRVGNLEIGEEFSLRALFGGSDAFAEVASPVQHKALGTQFRAAVTNSDFAGVEYSHHADLGLRKLIENDARF